MLWLLVLLSGKRQPNAAVETEHEHNLARQISYAYFVAMPEELFNFGPKRRYSQFAFEWTPFRHIFRRQELVVSGLFCKKTLDLLVQKDRTMSLRSDKALFESPRGGTAAAAGLLKIRSNRPMLTGTITYIFLTSSLSSLDSMPSCLAKVTNVLDASNTLATFSSAMLTKRVAVIKVASTRS